MEYRLNKIEPEIRQLVNDAVKEGKVHGNKDISKVDKDKREKQGKNPKDFKEELAKQSPKEKISVDAIKKSEIDIEASKEDMDLTKGRFLDTKI